jgi:hypothetical protein
VAENDLGFQSLIDQVLGLQIDLTPFLDSFEEALNVIAWLTAENSWLSKQK